MLFLQYNSHFFLLHIMISVLSSRHSDRYTHPRMADKDQIFKQSGNVIKECISSSTSRSPASCHYTSDPDLF